MLRKIEARRRLRRAWAIVCSLLFVVAVAKLLWPEQGVARAQRLPIITKPDSKAGLLSRASTSSASLVMTEATELHEVLHSSPTMLVSNTGHKVQVYPPLMAKTPSSLAAPAIIMLHGMCGDAQLVCDFWSDAGREGSFLICPSGNVKCGEYDDWKGTGEQKAAYLDQSMQTVDRVFGHHITHAQGDILIGFSRGAFVARDVVYARPGRYRALILIGASMTPDAERFKASGIQRIVMAAGQYDGARPTMQKATHLLNQAGIPTRYMTLGNIGHALPQNLESILREALTWIRQ